MPDDRRWADRPLVQLTLMRAREFFREPEAVFWTVLFPILMTTGLGLAFRSKPAEAGRVAVLGSAPEAEAVAARLRSSALDVAVLDDSAAARELRAGKVALLIVPQPGAAVEYRFDNTRPDAVVARRVVDDLLQKSSGRTDPVSVRETLIREPGSRYVDFVVPGLLGMSLLGSGVWGTGFPIVDSRRRRLLKRLIATPMPKSGYLFSLVISRIVVLVIEAGALLVFARLVFGVPFRGSLVGLGLICLLGALAFGALGLLVASRARTLEGASALMNLSMVPMWVMSGIFFSSTRFPALFQPFVQALPLTAVNDALRANMLEGATLTQIAPELGIVTAWLVFCFFAALALFRWQ